MNITYTRNGDYLIPNIIIRKTKPIGHYGRLRKAYLEMHRPILFNELVLSDATILIVCVIAFVLFIDAIAFGIIGPVPN